MAAPLTGPTGKKVFDITQIEQLESLAERQWSPEQIAAFFKCSKDVIRRRFANNIAEASQRGKAKLVDMAFKKATQGDTKMIIYLIERFCGQSGISMGDSVTNIQVHNYAKLPEEKLTETIDLLSAGATEVE